MRLDPRVKERLKKTFTQELATAKQAVTLVSAYQLSDDEVHSIMNKFKQFEGRAVDTKVDSSLIGGFVIQSGSQLIDLSIRNALHLLKKQLYESN